MWRDPLHVDEPAGFPICEDQVAEADESTLGCVCRVMEHRLAREESAEGQTIKATDELSVAPRLDRVRPSKLIQAGVRRGDPGGDPAAFA